MTNLEKAAELRGTLNDIRPMEDERAKQIVEKVMFDWIYCYSDHLSSLTLAEIKTLLQHGTTAAGKELKYHLEIIGYYEAIQLITELAFTPHPLTIATVKDLRKLFIRDEETIRKITPDGKISKKTVMQDNIYIMTKPTELMDWYGLKSNMPDVNSIELAAEFHYKVYNSYPYDISCTRMGALLMNYVLIKAGYPPLILNEDELSQAHTYACEKELGKFTEYIVDQLVLTLETTIADARGEIIETHKNFDLQIDALECRLRGRTVGTESISTTAVLLAWYDDSLVRLWKSFLAGAAKFDRFYQDCYPAMILGDKHHSYNPDSYKELRPHITDFSRSMSLGYRYEHFIDPGIKPFNYYAAVFIDFKNKEYYEIKYEDHTLRKEYGQQLSHDEVEHISEITIKSHHKFLEEQLKYAF